MKARELVKAVEYLMTFVGEDAEIAITYDSGVMEKSWIEFDVEHHHESTGWTNKILLKV